MTHYSRGKVSKELRNLIKLDFLEKPGMTEVGQKIYKLESITNALMRAYGLIFKKLEIVVERYKQIKEELEKEREELQTLNGYAEIYDTTCNFLEILDFYNDKIFSILQKSDIR